MKPIMGLDSVAVCFVQVRDGMIIIGQSAAEARQALEAVSARLPRSSVSDDAMHWTPPADGEAVLPCLA